ncbi:hypothetical protein B484DRAFT_406420 [Ochromonadaceae sp. CCMP2298]|nr:hypothetical protein B484DRAFT_406420 [Ochromonadaceae sp. CCMP2298]
MAHYAAMLHGVDAEALEFVVADTFAGLKAGAQAGTLDAFLWEVFTTQPSFQKNQVSGPEFCTPAVSEAIRGGLFGALREGVDIFRKEAEGGDAVSIQRIVAEYSHTPEDAKLWLSRCTYADAMAVDLQQIQRSLDILKKVGLVPPEYAVEKLWGGAVGEGGNAIIKLK